MVAYDERARELSQGVAALNDEIAAREEALREAVQGDRDALTAWRLADGKRPRPEPTARAIEREIEERRQTAMRQTRGMTAVFLARASEA